jgi:amino acid transporter
MIGARPTPVGLDRNTLSGTALTMMTLSAAAPLTGVAGGIVAAYGFGVDGVPAAFVVVTLAWACFTAGYVAVTRHVPHAGPFFAQIARSLGPAWGVAGATVALLAYNSIIFCLYGLAGVTMAGYWGGAWWAWAFVPWLVVAILGLLHVRLSAALLMLLLALEIAVVIGFDVAALGHPVGGRIDWRLLWPGRLRGSGLGAVIALTVACFLGVETSAAYREEARNHRHLRVAAFLGLGVLGALFIASALAVAAVAGPAHVVSADLVFDTLGTYDGLLVVILAKLLLVTSIVAAIISLHQTVARYVFVLARESLLPPAMGEIRVGHAAPVGGSVLQSLVSLAVGGVWALLGLDPMVLFNWGAALGALALMTVMVTTCVAVFWFFRRNGAGAETVFTRRVAPMFGAVGLATLLSATVFNLHSLVGTSPDAAVVWTLPALVAATAVIGLFSGAMARRRHPQRVFGLGEPEPLAEVPHKLIGVQL